VADDTIMGVGDLGKGGGSVRLLKVAFLWCILFEEA
jgi:hypothetical protein